MSLREVSELGRRARHEYLAGATGYAGQPTKIAEASFRGRHYVVLADSEATLAVYRVRKDATLRYLWRPPRALAPDWYDD